MINRSVAAVLALLMLPPVHAEPAVTARSAALQAQPQSDAATLASLPEHTRVEVLRRSGAWSEVRTAAGQTGWVRMASLKPAGDGAGPAAQASGNPLGALDTLLTSGRTSNKGTVTTGVRGLPKDDPQPAPSAPPRLTADEAAAHVFSQGSKLVPVPPEPAHDNAPAGERRNGTQ